MSVSKPGMRKVFELFELGNGRVTMTSMDDPGSVRQLTLRASARARRVGRMLGDKWPWTALGMSVAVFSGVALVGFGFEKLDLVLLVLGYGSAGLLLINTFFVVISAISLKLLLRRSTFVWSTDIIETGTGTRTGFSLPALSWVPLVQIHWIWEQPKQAILDVRIQGGRRAEIATLSRRGIYDSVERRIVVQDAFGLARLAIHHKQPVSLRVLPHLGGIRRLPVLTSLTGGDEVPHPMGLEDGDRVELRRYTPGDPARFIHWKVFGRTRKLMIRMPERALSRARRTVAYLITGPHDEAASAAARAAIEEEVLGSEWQFATDGAPTPTSDSQEALQKIMASSRFSGRSGSGLRSFIAEVDRRGPAALVIFAPPTDGPWLQELRTLTQARYGSVRVVIAVDAVRDASRASWWQRWLLRQTTPDGTFRGDLERVGRALGQLRCEVLIVDRVSGRLFGAAGYDKTVDRRAA